MKDCQLQNGLQRFLTDRLPEALILSLNAMGGEELVSVKKTSIQANSELISSMVASFMNSLDQCARLNLGRGKIAFSWTHENVLAQVLVGSIVISVLLNENANLGIIEERLLTLADVLKPICDELSPQTLELRGR